MNVISDITNKAYTGRVKLLLDVVVVVIVVVIVFVVAVITTVSSVANTNTRNEASTKSVCLQQAHL